MNRNRLLAKTLLKTLKGFEKTGNLSLMQDSKIFPLSTGLLSLDYFYNGGMVPAMYTLSGVEQSGKTLTASTILASAYKQGVPYLVYFDAESTLSDRTLKNLFDVESMGSLISYRKEGKTEIAPEVITVKGNTLEEVMDGVTSIVNMLPDKVYIEEEESWYFKVHKDTKDFKELTDQLEEDVRISKMSGYDSYHFYKDPRSTPKSSGIEAVIVIDSLAALLASGEDGSDPSERNNQLAKEAKEFSRTIKRFVGNLTRKQVLVIGINQTRENPGARFKDPSYEPGGSAIRFYSSAQIRAKSIASSTAKYDSDKESSVIDGEFEDRFQYKKFVFTKDKIGGRQNLEMIMRVWVEDALRETRGIDPAVDTKEYLKMTKQWEETRGRILIPTHPIFKDKSITWKQFKKLILSHAINRKEYRDLLQPTLKELGLTESVDLREWCFQQIVDRSVFDHKEMTVSTLPDELEGEGRKVVEEEEDVREI